jgi:GGDEF domain-containing protein
LLAECGATLQAFLGHLEQLHTDADSAEALSGLRKTLESALRAGNLGAAQQDATEKLEQLSQQAAEKRKQTLELTGRLQDRVTVLEHSVGVRPSTGADTSGPVDLSTGLPMRSEAEIALRRVIDSDSKSYAAVFYLHRMALTNARFGEAIGNQVILFCSQHIATTVTRGNDQLFRWSGRAFVAILERQESTMNVSSEVQRIVSAPLSRFFETASRSVYLPIKMTAAAVPLFDTNYAEALASIEQFILHASGPSHND